MTTLRESWMHVLGSFCTAGVLLLSAGSAQGLDLADQGWNDTDRNWFYTTTQGSRMVPWEWFLALEQPGGSGPFRDPDYLGRFGYLRPRNPQENPWGLPIGFVPDQAPAVEALALKRAFFEQGLTEPALRASRSVIQAKNAAPRAADGLFQGAQSLEAVRKELASEPLAVRAEAARAGAIEATSWLGLTCAACHTAELEHGGATLRVDGAPAGASFFDFAEALRASLDETWRDDARFERFARAVLGAGYSDRSAADLRAQVQHYTQAFDGLLARSQPRHAYRFGRLDAFGILLNEITGTGLNQPENYRVPDAPVSYPHLWGTPELTWVQWNGASEDPLARNVGEVLGVFADLRITDRGTTTSANVTHLHLLEEKVKSLCAPRWPAAWQPLNQELVARGKPLYAQRCQQCHAVPPAPQTLPNDFGRKLTVVQLVPLATVNTDPLAAANFLRRTAKTGPLAAQLGGQAELPVAMVLAAAVRRVMLTEFGRLQLTANQRRAYQDNRTFVAGIPAHLRAPHYKARSLEGIWATGPYLHNGSVPTLYDLLLPARRPADDARPVRPQSFRVGSREFDPRRVGLRSDVGEEVYDTTLPGNSNVGHEFGTDLSEDDRWALVEYLKTL